MRIGISRRYASHHMIKMAALLPLHSWISTNTGFAEACLDSGEEIASLCPVRVNCSGPCSRPILLFVHGLLGARSTWVGKGKSWPELVRDDNDLKQFDVYELDYVTHVQTAERAGKEIPTPENIVKSIQRVIKPALGKYRAVYMVCHSLGGNVMRDY